MDPTAPSAAQPSASPLRFVCDGMLGTLAKWLRLLGYDTLYYRNADDGELARMARSGDRLLLTRDRELARRRNLRVLLIESERPREQLAQVLGTLGLPAVVRLDRCPICNTPLEMRTSAQAKDRVPPYVFATQTRFSECPTCRRVYWPGTHVERMQEEMEQAGVRDSSPYPLPASRDRKWTPPVGSPLHRGGEGSGGEVAPRPAPGFIPATAPHSPATVSMDKNVSAGINPSAGRAWLTPPLLALLLLLAFALRVARLGAQGLWYDEGLSVFLARLPAPEIVARTLADSQFNVYPPLYYLALAAWRFAAGESEFALRFFSVWWGVLGVALVYALARRLFRRRAGLIALLLAALSPFLVYYAQEARMYTLVAALTLAGALCLLRGMERNRPGAWLGFGLLGLAAVYTHYATALTVAAQFLWLGIAWLRARGPVRKILLLGGVLAALVLAVGFAPWAGAALTRYGAYVSPSRGTPLGALLEETAVAFSSGHTILRLLAVPADPGYAADRRDALLVAAAFLVVAALAATRRPRRAVAFAALYTLVPLALFYLMSIGRSDFTARYAIAAYPGFVLLVAAGVERLRGWNRYAGWATLALLVALSGWALYNNYAVTRYFRADIRGAARYIAARAWPGDVVILDAPFFDPVFSYYLDTLPRMGLPARVPMDVTQTEAELAALPAEYERAWLVLWQDYYADPDALVRSWLDAHTFRSDAQSFRGPVTLYGYDLRPPVLTAPPRPQHPLDARFGESIRLLGYNVAPEAATPGGVLHLTLYWEALADVGESETVFVHVADATGRKAAQKDNRPASDRLPTDTWKRGTLVRDDYYLAVAPDAPAGTYEVLVGIYRAGGERLKVEGAGSRGDHAVLGTVRVER